jgi:putative transposase
MVYVSHLLKGHSVGLNEIDTGQWEVYFGPVKLGSFDERYAKGNSVPYLTLKV